MNETTKKKRTHLVFYILIFIAAVAGATAILLGLFGSKETYYSSTAEPSNVGSIYCVASTPDTPFFTSENALSEKHEVKVTFKSDSPDKVAYSYTGTFATAEEAHQAHADYHAKYNIYMGANNLDSETLTPHFLDVDNTARIDLFAEKKNLDITTAPLFYLSTREAVNFYRYTDENFRTNLESRGFTCTIDNNN